MQLILQGIAQLLRAFQVAEMVLRWKKVPGGEVYARSFVLKALCILGFLQILTLAWPSLGERPNQVNRVAGETVQILIPEVEETLIPPHREPVYRIANPFPPGIRPKVSEVEAFFRTLPDVDIEVVKALVRKLNAEYFGEQYWTDIDLLFRHESYYNLKAVQKDTGACGIGQALECGKMSHLDAESQVRWTMVYIRSRYGNPTVAWQKWLERGHACRPNPERPPDLIWCEGWY